MIYPRQQKVTPAKIFGLAFWRYYIVLMRPYLLFVSGITGLVGLSLAPALSLTRLLVLSLVFFLSYGFGQALTDCFQMDTDALSSPYRPLVQGKVQRSDVLTVSYLGLIVSGLILGWYSILTLPLALLGVIGLATYTNFKRKWWAGPFYNAWIVAVLCLIGLVAGVDKSDVVSRLTPILAATLLMVFFGYANFVLTGYFKDVSADRATGYHTLPVRFGLKTSSVISDVFSVLTLLGCGVAIYLSLSGRGMDLENATVLLFAAVGAATVVVAQVRLHRVQQETEAYRAIAPVVHAYILLLSAVATAQKPGWAFALLIFYLGFVITSKRRPMVQQI